MRLPQIGQKFRDRYLVEEVLGEGAFGAVYAATDTIASRPVALKILKPEGEDGTYDPKTKARFDREIKVVANLRSPHTVSLFDCGQANDGLLFSVFERVPGQDLSEHLRAVGRMPAHATVHVARQVLLSLQEAHSQGLLHRDIKPQNIRVFREQHDALSVKVLDFGLARDMRKDRPVVTEQGEVIGTPRYMAPEQLMDTQITPASDVYSLGIVMLEMMLGVDALHGTKFGDQIERLHTGHVFPVQGLEPSGLAPIITKMTARQPADRYPDAAAALRALEQWRAGMQQPSGQFARPASASSDVIPRPTGASSGALTRPAPSSESQTTPYSGSGPHDVGRSGNKKLALAALLIVGVVVAAGISAFMLSQESDAPPPTPPRERPLSALIATDDPPPSQNSDPVVERVDVGVRADANAADATAAAHPVAGCGAKQEVTGRRYLGHETLVQRSNWLTYIPENYDPDRTYPLVVVLHPTGQTPEELLDFSRFDLVAQKHEFVLILPQSPGFPAWNAGPSDDDWVRAAVEATREQLCIDERRVFLVAQGHGGYPAHRLTCDDWLAGVATNAFRMDENMTFCSSKKTVPYLLMSPTNGHDPWAGGKVCSGLTRKKSVEEVEGLWQKRNGCSGRPKATFRHKGSVCYSYDCQREFMSCHIKGGHNWPGSSRRRTDWVNCDNDAPDFPMAERVWLFFDALDPLPP